MEKIEQGLSQYEFFHQVDSLLQVDGGFEYNNETHDSSDMLERLVDGGCDAEAYRDIIDMILGDKEAGKRLSVLLESLIEQMRE